MKRIFTYPVILALLTVAFAGCQQESLSETGDAIRFSVHSVELSTVETKAVTTNPTDGVGLISDGSSVHLFGTLAGATDPVFAAGTTLNCSKPSETATPTWSYTGDTKYWVRGGAYTFRAVYPASATVTSGSGDEVVVSYDMASANYDLMVGAASVTAAPPTDNTVTLQFGHACAAVRVLFKDENGATAPNYTLNSFGLQGLYPAATFTSPATAGTGWTIPDGASRTSVHSWTGSWSVPEDYVSASSDSFASPGWYFVIPQALDATSKISFTYTIAGDETQILPVTVDLKTGGIEEWEPRMVYTYRIRIQANAITFTVDCEPWATGDEYHYTGK